MRLFKLYLLALGCLMTAGSHAPAQDQQAMYKIQSLFLYNFTKHVKWSGQENEAFTLGVYGNSTAFEVIKANIGSKLAWGKQINVVRIQNPGDVQNCHLVYMPRHKTTKIIELIDQCDFTNRLLVTEEDLLDYGAAISFVVIDSKLNFKINKSSLEAAGLKVSNSLVSLAASA